MMQTFWDAGPILWAVTIFWGLPIVFLPIVGTFLVLVIELMGDTPGGSRILRFLATLAMPFIPLTIIICLLLLWGPYIGIYVDYSKEYFWSLSVLPAVPVSIFVLSAFMFFKLAPSTPETHQE